MSCKIKHKFRKKMFLTGIIELEIMSLLGNGLRFFKSYINKTWLNFFISFQKISTTILKNLLCPFCAAREEMLNHFFVTGKILKNLWKSKKFLPEWFLSIAVCIALLVSLKSSLVLKSQVWKIIFPILFCMQIHYLAEFFKITQWALAFCAAFL